MACQAIPTAHQAVIILFFLLPLLLAADGVAAAVSALEATITVLMVDLEVAAHPIMEHLTPTAQALLDKVIAGAKDKAAPHFPEEVAAEQGQRRQIAPEMAHLQQEEQDLLLQSQALRFTTQGAVVAVATVTAEAQPLEALVEAEQALVGDHQMAYLALPIQVAVAAQAQTIAGIVLAPAALVALE